MPTLLAAIGAFLAAAVLFRNALPRDGKTGWFVGTIWEPYVLVGLIAASVLSFAVGTWSLIELSS